MLNSITYFEYNSLHNFYVFSQNNEFLSAKNEFPSFIYICLWEILVMYSNDRILFVYMIKEDIVAISVYISAPCDLSNVSVMSFTDLRIVVYLFVLHPRDPFSCIHSSTCSWELYLSVVMLKLQKYNYLPEL